LKKCLYILFVITAISCRKEIEFKLPPGTQSLVVNSNLCNDSLIGLKLTYTQAINNNNAIYTENNASIEIFDKDSVLLEKIINSQNGIYQTITTKAKASTCYLLKISTPQAIYWMKDSCPGICLGSILKVDSTIFQGKIDFYRIKFQLKDLQTCSNYYGLKMKHTYESYITTIGGKVDTILAEEWIDVETIDPLLTQDENNKFTKKHLLFNDAFFNNNTIDFSFGTSSIANSTTRKTKQLSIDLEQYSFDAYQFYATLFEHMFYQNDPFSQPTLVKGNINGAYGSFIGKNINRTVILFKY
jgi:hypothetical protein